MNAPTPTAPLSQAEHGDFWIHRDGDRSGPFSLTDIRARVAAWQILPEDEIEITANGERLSGAALMKTARLLEPLPRLRYAGADAIITAESVLAKDRVIRIADITRIALILPEPPKEKILTKMDRTLIWTLGILFFWTLLAPVVAWYLTRKDFKEEGLGAIHGLLLQGNFEDFLILDGLGILPANAPRRLHLQKISALLESLRHPG
jgi:hypothetical protein